MRREVSTVDELRTIVGEPNKYVANKVRDRLSSIQQDWLAQSPLGFVATWAGWVTREVGRQPWTIYGLLRTSDSASELPPAAVATSFVVFVLVYLALTAGFLVFARRLLMRGPDLTSPIPDVSRIEPLREMGIRRSEER